MSLKDILKIILLPIVIIYFSAVLGYLIMISTTAEKSCLLDALSPVLLFNEVLNGNSTVIYTIGAGIMLYIYLRRFFRREDLEEKNEDDSTDDYSI